MREIQVSAVVMCDPAGRVLSVRKRGTVRFMLPGGKPEPGEGPFECARREIREEVSVTLDPAQLLSLGTFRAAAANEPDHTVVASLFRAPYSSRTRPGAEIAELAWIDPLSSRDDLAPLTTEIVFPLLRART